jgi:hypothetical protein
MGERTDVAIGLQREIVGLNRHALRRAKRGSAAFMGGVVIGR